MQRTHIKLYNKNETALWKLSVHSPCRRARPRVLPLSLPADGSSKAICSASSDRESSTGRALRKDMDSLRLMIFILSIFSVPPPGAHRPKREREREATNSTINHHWHHLHRLPNHYSCSSAVSYTLPHSPSTVQWNNCSAAPFCIFPACQLRLCVCVVLLLCRYIRIKAT